jgi:uncharacterized protein (TIGR02246 family)
MSTMDALQRLVDIEEIRQLKYRYQRSVDQHDWDALADCFTDDAVSSYSDGKYAFTGRDAIVGFLRSAMDREALLTSHHVHHPEIALTSDTTATGIWALHDTVIDQDHDALYEGAAYYHDEYVKQDDQWRISRTGYERVWEHYHQRHSASGWEFSSPDA